MSTTTEKIEAIKSAALDRMAEVLASPKPNYTEDGISYSWGDYLAKLRESVAWCNEQLTTFEGDGPFEVVSEAFT